jgi:hypothetical protein
MFERRMRNPDASVTAGGITRPRNYAAAIRADANAAAVPSQR